MEDVNGVHRLGLVLWGEGSWSVGFRSTVSQLWGRFHPQRRTAVNTSDKIGIIDRRAHVHRARTRAWNEIVSSSSQALPSSLHTHRGSPCSRSLWSYQGSSSSVTNSSILPARSISSDQTSSSTITMMMLIHRLAEPEVATNNGGPASPNLYNPFEVYSLKIRSLSEASAKILVSLQAETMKEKQPRRRCVWVWSGLDVQHRCVHEQVASASDDAFRSCRRRSEKRY